jgi:hypothetical protein
LVLSSPGQRSPSLVLLAPGPLVPVVVSSAWELLLLLMVVVMIGSRQLLLMVLPSSWVGEVARAAALSARGRAASEEVMGAVPGDTSSFFCTCWEGGGSQGL